MTKAKETDPNSSPERSQTNQGQETGPEQVGHRRHELISGAVHDIRTPLQNIKGYTELYQGIFPSQLIQGCLAIDQILVGIRGIEGQENLVTEALLANPTTEGARQVVDFLVNVRHWYDPERNIEEIKQEILEKSEKVEFGLYDLAAIEMIHYASNMEDQLAQFKLHHSGVPANYPFTLRNLETGLSIVKKSIDRLQRYVNESRFLIYVDSLEPVSTNFSPGLLFDQLVSQFESSLAAVAPTPELTYHSALPEDLLINSDPVFVDRIFTNLVENAKKYADKKDPKISISATRDENSILLTISDNGIGFKDNGQIGKTPGTRTVESQSYAPGTGYGLWFSGKLAERLGGAIEPYSEGIGKGATFTFRLPI